MDGQFLTRVRSGVRVLDLAAILVVPVVLVVVAVLPVGLRDSLVLSTTAPGVVPAYTTHFVHATLDHLLGNLTVYGLSVPVCYLLAALADRHRGFRVPFVTVLLSLPFVLSALYLLLGSTGRVLGFSGLNMAFVGMVPLFLTLFLGRFAGGVGLQHAPALFFAGAALIAIRVVPDEPARSGLILAALGLALWYGIDAWPDLRAALADLVGRPGEFELVGTGTVLFFLVVYLGFPSDPTGSAGIVDVYTHFLGYAFGFLPTYLFLGVQGSSEGIPSPPETGKEKL